MAMDIDPFSMLEVSLQEGPDVDDRRPGQNSSSGVMHQVENDVQILQPPPPLHYFGSDILTPQRAVLNNIQKLSATSKDEEKFRRRAYSSISLVLRKRLHCTICDAHIGAYLGLKEMDIEHPLLKVLACSKCTLKYHYLEFPLNIDGRDVRCRWCTNSSKEESPLRFCNYCPFAFCEMCIYRNLPLDELASNKSNWVCFVCNVKDLWPSRAVLWALRVLIDTNLALKEEKKWSTDQSTCCKNKVTKQRRMIMPQGGGQPTNGHNVAVRAVVPNQFRMTTTQNNYLLPYTRPPQPPPPAVRPVAMPQQTAYRGIRPVVQPVRPVNMPVTSIATNSSTTQLYDTSWLTDKVSNISTTLLNLNNNLHRLAQGIPEKENKYSIKSKMISMVSLLNISATQLQKASKEMEEESKRILDKNYRVARITPIVSIDNKPEPVASTSRAGMSSTKRPPPRNRSTSSRRNKRRRRASQTDTDSDPDDPDFRTKAKLDGVSEEEDEDASWSSAQSYQTRLCFVKLERLDEKVVAEYKSGDESDSKSDTESTSGEPKPSTSSAPDPLAAMPPSELADRRDADSGSGDTDLKKEETGDDHTPSEFETDPATNSKETDNVSILKETEATGVSEKSEETVPAEETDYVSASEQVDNSILTDKTDDVAADCTTISEETDVVSASKQVDNSILIEKTDDVAADCTTISEETDKLPVSQETRDESKQSPEPARSDESRPENPDQSQEASVSGEPNVETPSLTRNSPSEMEVDSFLPLDVHKSSTIPGFENKEPAASVENETINANDESRNTSSDSSSADSSTTLDTASVVHKSSTIPGSENKEPAASVENETINANDESRNTSSDSSSADSSTTLDTSTETSKSDSTEETD